MIFLFLGDMQSGYGYGKIFLSRKKENGVNGITDLPVTTWETKSDRHSVEMKTSYTV